MEMCDNCYDEVKTVSTVKGMSVCKECKKEMNGTSYSGILDNLDDMVGVESDNDVINYYSDIANSYNDTY